MPPIAKDFEELSVAERLQLIESIWDSLENNFESLPVPDGLIEELDRRQAALEANPDSALTWEEVLRRVRERHGR